TSTRRPASRARCATTSPATAMSPCAGWTRSSPRRCPTMRRTRRRARTSSTAATRTPTRASPSGTTTASSRSRATAAAPRTARPRVRERAHGGADAAAARRRPHLLLPVHRPGQPDVEQHLPADRLRAGQRPGSLDVFGLVCARNLEDQGRETMRKASLFVALSAALVFAAAGSAITNGVPDGNAHPEVGALLATHAFSDGTWEECTGTLI